MYFMTKALKRRGFECLRNYEVHQAQEVYLDQFRRGGARAGRTPTNLEMNRATLDALQSAGYSPEQARVLVREAVKDRVKYGVLGGEEVPRIPRHINQVPPNEP